jgi:hypothetical protein
VDFAISPNATPVFFVIVAAVFIYRCLLGGFNHTKVKGIILVMNTCTQITESGRRPREEYSISKGTTILVILGAIRCDYILYIGR